MGSNFLGKRSLRDSPVYISHQLEPRQRGCVNCDSTEHRPHECIKVADMSERSEKVSLKQRALFQLYRRCKSRKTCLFCKRRHHTSICDKGKSDNSMTVAQIGDSPLVYPEVVVEVAGIKFRALPDSGAGSSYALTALREKVGAKLRHSRMLKIETMLSECNRLKFIGSNSARLVKISRRRQM